VPNTDVVLIDAIGRQRSKVTLPGYLAGRAPHNKGMRYPADPPRVEEIIAVMRHAGEDRHGLRVRAVIACCGAAACGSPRCWRSLRPMSTRPEARCWSGTAKAIGAARWAWTTGGSSTSTAGSSTASSYQLVRCSASSPARPAGAAGQRPLPAVSFADSPPRLACGVGSRPPRSQPGR
jgi:hypothetical protein